MQVDTTPIAGVYTVDTEARGDQRGTLTRLFCADDLSEVIADRTIVQINRTMTHEVGAVRGLHFQHPPHAETKLIRCIRGRVFDVAVDLRRGSPTFLRWHACELSADNDRMFVIPEGCAHGVQVLEPQSEMLYLHTALYAPEAEGGIRHDDPAIGVAWPLAPNSVSPKDESYPLIDGQYEGIAV